MVTNKYLAFCLKIHRSLALKALLLSREAVASFSTLRMSAGLVNRACRFQTSTILLSTTLRVTALQAASTLLPRTSTVTIDRDPIAVVRAWLKLESRDEPACAREHRVVVSSRIKARDSMACMDQRPVATQSLM